MKCSKDGCENHAEGMVGAVLRPSRDSVPADIVFPIYLCPVHAAGIQWEDVISDEAWKLILSKFKEAKRALPKRKYSYVFVKPLQGSK
jgi:hypothetical protein